MCNNEADVTTGINFYCVLLIFAVNMHGLFFWKIKKWNDCFWKKIFSKSLRLNWIKEVFFIKNVIDTSPWTDVIEDFYDEIVEIFNEKELQKINQSDFRTGKMIKKKGNKIYDNLFNIVKLIQMV